MKGQLSHQPLPEIISEILTRGSSGTLRLESSRVRVAIYFEAGRIIYAASNARDLRIATYLKKHGIVFDESLEEIARKKSDSGLIGAISARNLVGQGALRNLLAKQVRDILRVALLWLEGTWVFDERTRLGDYLRVEVETHALLGEVAERKSLEFLSSRFPDPDEIVSPIASITDLEHLSPMEGFVMSRVDSPLRISELVALTGLGDLKAYRTIYALTLIGYLSRERTESLIFKTPVRKQSEPIPDTTAAISPTSEVVTKAEPEEKSPEEILKTFTEKAASAETFYELLEVDPGARVDEIKCAYHALARRYHPDRFRRQGLGTIYTKLESTFAGVTQAYETLTNAERRATYDAKLTAQRNARKFGQTAPKPSARAKAAGGNEVPGEHDQRAEENFRGGYSALEQGQVGAAVIQLAAAARLVPSDPRYRAYYGRALAAHDKTRRLAEAEIQAAIKLDPTNAHYKVMLSELYCDLGFLQRAQNELERAAAIDPNDPGIEKARRKLSSRRRGQTP